MKRFAAIFLHLSILCSLIQCSAKSEKKSDTDTHSSATWNYDQIRKTREGEQANQDANPIPENSSENCTVISATQMKRSKAAGCKPVDERLGFGSNMFCCPAQAE